MIPVLALHFKHTKNVVPPLFDTTFACDPFKRIDPSAAHSSSPPPLHRAYRLIRPANRALSIFSVMSPLPVAPSTVPFAIDGASSTIFDVSVVICFARLSFAAHIKKRPRQQGELLHRNNTLRVDQHRRPARYVPKHHRCRLRVEIQRGPRRSTREAKKKAREQRGAHEIQQPVVEVHHQIVETEVQLDQIQLYLR